MKVYLVARMEGVAGLIDGENWLPAEGRYHDAGRRLLTDEVNAAADGFFAAGATEVVVDDAHDPEGLDIERLDERCLLLHGLAPDDWPRRIDESCDALAFVGQYAKAGSTEAHLCHTGPQWRTLDLTVNGLSVGDLGLTVLAASALGVRTVFVSGDRAACREAEDLLAGVVTAEVKYGSQPTPGEEWDAASYRRLNANATHLSPSRACALIRERAQAALRGTEALSGDQGLRRLDPPYVRVERFRECNHQPSGVNRDEHPSDLLALLRIPARRRPDPGTEAGGRA